MSVWSVILIVAIDFLIRSWLRIVQRRYGNSYNSKTGNQMTKNIIRKEKESVLSVYMSVAVDLTMRGQRGAWSPKPGKGEKCWMSSWGNKVKYTRIRDWEWSLIQKCYLKKARSVKYLSELFVSPYNTSDWGGTVRGLGGLPMTVICHVKLFIRKHKQKRYYLIIIVLPWPFRVNHMYWL